MTTSTRISFATLQSRLRPIFDLKYARSPEQKFLQSYVQQSISSTRISLIIGLVLWCLFGIVDFYAAPISVEKVWVVRYLVIAPVFSLAYLLTGKPQFVNMSQVIFAMLSAMVGFGVVLIIYFTKPNELAHQLYYGGLILTIVMTHTTLRLDATLACIASSVTIVMYNVVMIFFNPLTSDEITTLATNNCILVAVLIISTYSSIASTRASFNNFRQKRIIEHDKEKLMKSEAKLAELNHVKSKLISIMSHDLRGPLASVKGILNLFALGMIAESDFRYHLTNLSFSIDGTMMLLDNLLSWTVMQIQKTDVTKRKTEIRGLVSNVYTIVKPHADRKKVKLVNDIPAGFQIEVEPTMIELVLRNLVTNGIKFTENGKVMVRLLQFEKSVQIIVEDTGVGMTDEIAHSLFKWKQRNSGHGTQMEKGFGIGLLICKEFIEKHGGVIGFTSKLNKGTMFFINLPCEGNNVNEEREQDHPVEFERIGHPENK